MTTQQLERGDLLDRWIPLAAKRIAARIGAVFLKRLKIGGKLTIGFSILVALTLLVVGLNYLGSLQAVSNINRTSNLRAPSALASAQAQANLLRMLGAVRGYLALGEEAYRVDYDKASAGFAGNLAELERLLRTGDGAASQATVPGYGQDLAELKSALDHWRVLPSRLFNLRDDQLRREPALQILIVDATPLIASIVVSMKAVVGTQQRREATPANMTLLADMGSFQSSFFAMVAGLRGYVTTARETFKYEYESNLTINKTAWGNLIRKKNLLDAGQKTKLDKAAKDLEAFLKLPANMFEAVEGEHARQDLFIFRTEAVPLAEKMLRLLDQIAAEEQALLQSDLSSGRRQLLTTQQAILLGGAIAVAFGLALGFIFKENIAGPVGRLTTIAERVREGDLTARAEIESGDEIGHLAETFNSMTVRLGDSLADLNRRRGELELLSTKLSKYLSPQVYSSIFTGRQEVMITSKRKKLTIFFSDIAGFTETTDSLESEQLTELLNSYLTEMSKIALDHGATIDKYVGDAMLIFFGDPESRGVKEDALACARMAIAMQRRMNELQAEWRDLGSERPFQLRIGINTGFCTVGNFGSEDRMDYTIIGNEVNLAARLQSHAALGGILLAHETYSLVRDAIPCVEREPVRVKGFAKPIRNYEVTGIHEASARDGQIVHAAEEGFALHADLNRLSADGRAKAIRAVEELLARLRG